MLGNEPDITTVVVGCLVDFTLKLSAYMFGRASIKLLHIIEVHKVKDPLRGDPPTGVSRAKDIDCP
jgi:hypothetical protein